jgi:hypothetical protein
MSAQKNKAAIKLVRVCAAAGNTKAATSAAFSFLRLGAGSAPVKMDLIELAAVPALTGKAIESVTIVITTPVAAMIITVGTTVNRSVPEPTDRDSRRIDPHGQVRMRLRRHAGTHTGNYQSCADCNE